MAKTRNIAKQNIVIAELAKGATREEAAEKAHISASVPSRWYANDPDYRERLALARERISAKYMRHAERAADRAGELLESEEGAVALGAVKLINDRALGPVNAPSVQITHNTVSITPEQRAKIVKLTDAELDAAFLPDGDA